MRVRFFGFCVEVGVEFFGESKRKRKSRRQRRFDCARAFSLKEETFFFSVHVEGKKTSRSLGSCVSFEKRGTETARRRRRRNGKKTMAAKQAASMQRVFSFSFPFHAPSARLPAQFAFEGAGSLIQSTSPHTTHFMREEQGPEHGVLRVPHVPRRLLVSPHPLEREGAEQCEARRDGRRGEEGVEGQGEAGEQAWRLCCRGWSSSSSRAGARRQRRVARVGELVFLFCERLGCFFFFFPFDKFLHPKGGKGNEEERERAPNDKSVRPSSVRSKLPEPPRPPAV